MTTSEKKQNKVKNSLNAAQFERHYEYNAQPSETVPDQTLTIKQILDRFARGLPVNRGIQLYDEEHEDNDLPDFRTMDFAEREEFREAAEQELSEIKAKHKRKKDEQEKPTPPAGAGGNTDAEKPVP